MVQFAFINSRCRTDPKITSSTCPATILKTAGVVIISKVNTASLPNLLSRRKAVRPSSNSCEVHKIS